MQTLSYTNFNFHNQTGKKVGKVRDTYIINNDLIISITTDRISAFDYVLKSLIPFKGQVLNNISAFFLKKTTNIINNWLIDTPHKNVSIGLYCTPYPIEVIVRRYLSGSSWRNYKNGNRILGGIQLPENLYENAKLPQAIITPSTKNDNGHDIDITKEEIINTKLIDKSEYEQIEKSALELFYLGETTAEQQGLILADTKYEFGKRDNKIYLIDEIHTPDSSRYFYKDSLNNGNQENNLYKLSKEYLRKWLIANNYNNDNDLYNLSLPESIINTLSNNYIELYETLIPEKINKNLNDNGDIYLDIKDKIESFLSKY